MGFYVGGFATISINDTFKIQPEVLFASQGSNLLQKDVSITFDIDEPPIVGDFNIRTRELTISVPVLAQYYVNEKIYMEAGPQFGLIIDQKVEVTETPYEDPEFDDLSVDDYDTFDFGLAAGLGYNLNDKFAINFRYFLGLIKRDFSEVQSSVLNLGLAYKL